MGEKIDMVMDIRACETRVNQCDLPVALHAAPKNNILLISEQFL